QLAAYAWKADAQKNGRFTGKGPELHYHHATIAGLRGSTTYHFVMAGEGGVSSEFHFVTAPSEDAPFRLLVGGDSRSNAEARRKMNGILAQALEKDPTILALWHGGDFMKTGTSLTEWAEWMGDHELTATASGRMLPVLPVRGNHEKSGVQFDEVWNWPGGGLGKNYSATKLGPQALLVTLNTNVSTEGNQAAFLERTLQENAKVRWQLAGYHRPAYPAVKSPSAGKEAWVPIFEKHDLDLVCESDGHNIKRTVPIRNDQHDPTGVVYIGEGGLGVSQRTPDDDLWYLQPPGKCGKGHHYFLLTFEKEALRTKVVLMDGTVFDEYEMKPRRR
ncbi:MAG TPA: metallophosphoesterase, partial [Planctomycetota bacterium]|nr:metallophosphoesterase [Planctomycetota bacterium]